MNSRKIKLTIFILSYITIFMSINILNSEVIAFKGENPIVLFDIAHEQIFNNTHMQSAIQYIRDKYEATVFINRDDFTATNLRGVDLLILMAPTYDIENPYEDLEQLAVKEYIENEDKSSVLFLANPYIFESEYRNLSSNTIHLNSIMSDNYGDLNLLRGPNVLMNDFDNRYDDQRFIYIDNSTIDTANPIIQGRIEEEQVNQLLTMSTSLYVNSGGDRFINTTASTYYLNYQNDPAGQIASGSVHNHSIIVSKEDLNGRVIVSGSAIMFSDLEIPGANITWYEAYDNAQLWKNMIEWLFYQIPLEEELIPIPDFWVFVLAEFGAFLIVIVIGSVLYTVGKDVKRVEISETIQKMRARDERKSKTDEEIDEAFYAEDEIEEEKGREEIVEEEKEVDMKSISDEIKKKPPKTRSRSERRRRN